MCGRIDRDVNAESVVLHSLGCPTFHQATLGRAREPCKGSAALSRHEEAASPPRIIGHCRRFGRSREAATGALQNPFRVRAFCDKSQGWPTFVGQPWAVLHNAFSVDAPRRSVTFIVRRASRSGWAGTDCPTEQ